MTNIIVTNTLRRDETLKDEETGETIFIRANSSQTVEPRFAKKLPFGVIGPNNSELDEYHTALAADEAEKAKAAEADKPPVAPVADTVVEAPAASVSADEEPTEENTRPEGSDGFTRKRNNR